MIDIYEKTVDGRKLKFMHLSDVAPNRYNRNLLFRGVLVDENLHTQQVDMNPSKMTSRGWKKVPEPLLSLKEQMLSDVTELNKQIASGSHVVRIGEVIQMIAKYAGLVELSEKVDVRSGSKTFW